MKKKRITKLHQVIRERGVYQKEVAEAAGIDPGQFSHYVNGQVEPNPETKGRIAEALDMPVNEVFCPFSALPPVDAEIEGVIVFLRSPEGHLFWTRLKQAAGL